MSNRERILETALELMNEAGAQAVGTSRIAQALGVSPGNLYYHFKNREDIVRALFAGLDAEFRAILVDDVTPPISAARFADSMLAGDLLIFLNSACSALFLALGKAVARGEFGRNAADRELGITRHAHGGSGLPRSGQTHRSAREARRHVAFTLTGRTRAVHFQ